MSISEITVARAGPRDTQAVLGALAAIASDLGDPFEMTEATLARALHGPHAHSAAVLARNRATPVGVALFSPYISTVAGTAGVYVSDLWVTAEARGQALGQRLLAAEAQEGAALWQARVLSLYVYGTNASAYRRMWFEFATSEQRGVLRGPTLTHLMADT